MSLTQDQPKRARKSYSRNGCRECKRRKIRCPEEKPYCSTCVRLGKQCSYPLAGEKVLRISRRLIKEEIENMGKSTQFLPVQYDVPKRVKPQTASSIMKPSPLNIENLINNNDFLSGTDLSSLTTDLNNLVTGIMEVSNIPFLEDDFQFDFLNDPLVLDEVTKNVPIDYIKLPRKHEQLYWEEFYNNFAQIIEPFQAYHALTKTTSNPARDIILQTAANEPFLLAAVLAEGANTCYLKYKRPEDERAYGAYLSKCLKLLESARGETDLNANIEAVLLTLLLLTAATATSQTQQWRPHLVGAKSLLIKAFNQNVSKKFVFCKFWFISIEILAGLSTNIGGTLQTDYEIDRLITSGNEYEVAALRDLGLITDQGFNILMGFDNTCISCFGELLKLLNQKRAGTMTINTMEYVKVLSNFYNQANIVYIDERGVVPEKELTRYIPGLPIEELRVNNESFWISWQDISHQSYVLSSIIMILTRFFVIDVSSLVDKMISFIQYLNQFSDVQQHASPYLLLMIQWPLLVTGLSTTKLEQRHLLLKYFSMVGQIGAASAHVSTQILLKHWKGTIDTENDDTLIY
ncbi:LYS14 Lysine biosynthesis regulatory protein LYS14 [Candida maltosa Xu316]